MRSYLFSAVSALFLSLLAAGCTGFYSQVFHQDDPALFTPVAPLYRMPLAPGHQQYLLAQGVGGRFTHTGDQTWAFDWTMPRSTPVPAARGGTVAAVRCVTTRDTRPFGERQGNEVRIRHADGSIAVYAHIDSTVLRVGDALAAGDTVALSGNTGNSTHPHLHFHVEKNGRSIPIAFVDCDDPYGIPRAGSLYRGSRP